MNERISKRGSTEQTIIRTTCSTTPSRHPPAVTSYAVCIFTLLAFAYFWKNQAGENLLEGGRAGAMYKKICIAEQFPTPPSSLTTTLFSSRGSAHQDPSSSVSSDHHHPHAHADWPAYSCTKQHLNTLPPRLHVTASHTPFVQAPP